MKDRNHTEWGPHLSSFSFPGTVNPLSLHIKSKQKATVLGWGVKRSEFGAARVTGYGNRKSKKGNTKGNASKILEFNNVIGYKVNIKKPVVFLYIVVVDQSFSRVRIFVTPWTAAHQASLSFTISWSLLKLVHWVRDAIQPSHPLSSPSPPALNLSQHQGFFQWVGSLHHVAKGLQFQLQHQFFQWIFRTDVL